VSNLSLSSSGTPPWCSPAHVSALSGPTVRSASGQLPRSHRLEQRHCRPGCPPPLGRRHPLVGHPVPPRDSALTRSAYRALEQPGPRQGFHVPRRHDRGGCPPYPETSGVPTTDSHCPVAACRLFQRPGPTTLVFTPPPRARNNEASTGIHSRSPVRSSPRPLLPQTEQGPFSFPLDLAPPRTRPADARQSGDRSQNTDRELRTRHNRPPNCELTRNTRPRCRRRVKTSPTQVKRGLRPPRSLAGPVLAPLRAADHGGYTL
jgi:hypothetical protein